MANTREIKKFEDEFRLDLSENKNFENLSIKLNEKEVSSQIEVEIFKNSDNFKSNSITKSLENNFYLTLNENSKLNISNCGILNILIEKDLDLELIFEGNNFSNVFVKIFVKKNVKFNLIDFSNNKFLYKNIEIILDENSILKNSQFILNSKISFVKINLKKNSDYLLKSVYFSNSQKNYIKNNILHLDEKSKSNLEINGLSKGNSKTINDAIVEIKKSAKNSIGHQKMHNILLDNLAQIQSEPILEVENNNVECSHSSSISQINENILYYLESRGICEDDSIKLFFESFFTKVIFNIENEKLKENYIDYFENFKF